MSSSKHKSSLVVPYSIARLLDELSFYSESTREIVEEKYHALYFEHYFESLEAKTFIVEEKYIDHDYLEDFVAYYARCFQQYKRHCARFHFFDKDFSQEEFVDLIVNRRNTTLQKEFEKSYLGYVVVRPLPRTMIGKTCLRTYPSDGRRHYPITRDYKANLYGLELSIQTLAFQEQDGELSRCATTAVWSSLQGTGIIFQHHILTPAEVTTVANELSPSEGRSIPSDGLNMLQMANAVRRFGLEPLFIQPDTHDILKSSLYAYLRYGVPVILGVTVLWAKQSNEARLDDDLHAITATGYSLSPGTPSTFEGSELRLAALRVDKFYAHDDQVGPFSRLVVREEPVEVRTTSNSGLDKTEIFQILETSVIEGDETQSYFVDSLLAPVYHKIRVPFKAILDRIMLVNDPLSIIGAEYKLFDGNEIEWDIFLTDVSQFKNDIRSQGEGLSRKQVEKVLLSSYPRFLWRAVASISNARVIDILFDATDIEQGKFFQDAFLYDSRYGGKLRRIILDPSVKALTDADDDAVIWQHLRSNE